MGNRKWGSYAGASTGCHRPTGSGGAEEAWSWTAEGGNLGMSHREGSGGRNPWPELRKAKRLCGERGQAQGRAVPASHWAGFCRLCRSMLTLPLVSADSSP